MKSPRTFPRLVMKEWPDKVGKYTADYSPLTEVEVQAAQPELDRLYANSKVVSDFTRVVDQTDPEARKEARQSKMHHDRAPTK